MSTGSAGRWAVANARVVTPERVVDPGHVVVEGARIAEVGAGSPDAPGSTVDAGGRLLLPGLVDLHGDGIERHLFPRSGARVPTGTAVVTCDRENVAAGITTKFHAVAFEDDPDGERSIELAGELADALADGEGLLADNRVHARCELGDEGAADAVVGAIDRGLADLVSLMNHLPDGAQFDDEAQFARRYADGGTGPAGDARGVIERRSRADDPHFDPPVRRVVEAATEAGLAIASHDDDDPRRVEAVGEWGVSISEYPVTMAAAGRASELGLDVAMGAPNLVRGGSLWGNLAAADAIRAGHVDVLCADYHPQSLLSSVLVDTGEPLPVRVGRVSRAPADAVGLDDRGRIEPGARADLVVVAPGPPPRVTRSVVAGTTVFRAGG